MGDVVPDDDMPTSDEVPAEDMPGAPDRADPNAGYNPMHAIKGAAGVGENLLSGVTGAAGSLADAVTGSDPGTHDWAYRPRTDAGKLIQKTTGDVASAAGNVLNDDLVAPAVKGWGGDAEAARDTLAERVPEALGATGAVTGVAGLLRPKAAAAVPKAFTPEEAVANTTASQSMGARAVAPDLSVADPELRGAFSQAAQKTGGAVHPVAMDRHLDTAQLPLPEGATPLRLRAGQATGDAQQISDEKNLRADPDTQGLLSDSITDQDNKLVGSMGEIRRQATPDIVQRNNAEHGQAAVDSIKNWDNQTTLDKRAKYQALADANGGNVPIDSGTAINDIDTQLSNKFLTKTAHENGVVSSVMDSLRSGKPMSFESFENARSGLAEVQRSGGNDAFAAGIVHDALENMPLSADAAPLKGLADTARNAARAQFDTIKQNPGYKAAIEDNVPKDNNRLHVIGAPSPLADSFMDRYALGNGTNASKAYIQRLKDAVPDPVLSQSIEAASLNKLRDAAGIDAYGNGSFRNASYRNASNALAPKADALMSPDSIENTNRLKRVSGYVNDEGKASSVNRSNTALALQRFGATFPSDPTIGGQLLDYGTDAVAGHLGPVGVIGKRVGQAVFKKSQDAKALQSVKDAKLKFAQDATKPGAGLDALPSVTRPQRASGGKVLSHEQLVERLIKRWRDAKKATDASTKPLLGVPDAAIVKALHIAGSAI
jgi:hypothetical protein